MVTPQRETVNMPQPLGACNYRISLAKSCPAPQRTCLTGSLLTVRMWPVGSSRGSSPGEKYMIGSVTRSIAAVIAGLVLAMVLIVAVEVFSSLFHPFPPDVDPTDLEV